MATVYLARQRPMLISRRDSGTLQRSRWLKLPSQRSPIFLCQRSQVSDKIIISKRSAIRPWNDPFKDRRSLASLPASRPAITTPRTSLNHVLDSHVAERSQTILRRSTRLPSPGDLLRERSQTRTRSQNRKTKRQSLTKSIIASTS
jgi:hypothetical protein